MVAAILRKYGAIAPAGVKALLNLYAPFRGAGIRVQHISDDHRYMRVEMPLTWYNRNYVGTHFGGSIYAMSDPFYMMMLMRNLGSQYIVWDKSAMIEFIKPGRGRLIVEFRWSEDEIEAIKTATAQGERHYVKKHVEIRDDQGELIATVDKTLYVRRKDLASKPR